MRYGVLAASVIFVSGIPASAQANLAKYESEQLECLNEFDATARAKRLSAADYKVAIEGVCTDLQPAVRSLYALRLSSERGIDRGYMLEQFDRKWNAMRTKLVAAYIMRK